MTQVQVNFGAPGPSEEPQPERRASWLELFYDLCFVVAVGAVATTLHGDPTSSGGVMFAALFIPVWWSWLEYAWYATSFPEGGMLDRFAAFAAMLTVLAMAAQVGAASAGDPRGYLLAFVIFHAIVVALFWRASRLYPDRRSFAIRYAVGLGLSALVWLISLAFPPAIQPWVWALALLIDLVTPWNATSNFAGRSFDASHIPERYGLFTLIVLGEAIIAVARGTAEAHWTPSAVATAVAGFIIAVVIWWAYFARHQDALLLRGQLWAFIWGYGHVFVWAGIAMTGVGIELAIEAAEANHGFPTGERLILCGGFALFLAAMALLRAADAGTFADPIALVRLTTAAAILLFGVTAGGLSPEAATIVIGAIAICASVLARRAWQTLPAATTT